MVIDFGSEATMDEQTLLERRRLRQRRIQRTGTRGKKQKNLLSSPISAVFCMSIALGSILAFWGGLPRWALLALGLMVFLVVR